MDKKGAFIIGGTSLIGIGIGFILLKYSALFFIASILIGVGLGLLISAIREKQ